MKRDEHGSLVPTRGGHLWRVKVQRPNGKRAEYRIVEARDAASARRKAGRMAESATLYRRSDEWPPKTFPAVRAAGRVIARVGKGVGRAGVKAWRWWRNNDARPYGG